MMNSTESNDIKILDEYRAHYEGQGLKFIVTPNKEQLPDFLREIAPSAVAIGATGGVVLQVRHIGPDIGEVEKLKLLASKVRRFKDWSLDVVLASNDKSFLLPSASQVKEESTAVREEIVRHKSGSSTIGSTTYLLLYAWSLFEAIARRTVFEIRTTNLRDNLSAKILIENLLEDDLIEDFEANRLVEIMQIRNFASHGFKNKEVKMNDVDFLIDIIDRLSTEQVTIAS